MKKVLIGMSGGVDSSVAAFLLQKEGYEVIGVTMRMWEPSTTREHVKTCAAGIEEDAKKVANQLGIRHIVVDMTGPFLEHVRQNFVDEYLKGRTPNPCVQCNRYIKWEQLLKEAERLNADYIATGHYAQVIQLQNKRFTLKSAVAGDKDQTYALYRLTQDQLKHTLMPIGAYSKSQVRSIAKEAGLCVASKSDSMEICFIPDHDYAKYIEENATDAIPPEGNFILGDHTIIGRHKGIIHYTIGQRKGLNLAMGHPIFVTKINPATNEVVIGEGEDVFTNSLKCNQLSFMGMEDVAENRIVTAKIRYAHKGSEATLIRTKTDEITCLFSEPVRAVTPGQSVVFYEDNYVLGGGIIFDT